MLFRSVLTSDAARQKAVQGSYCVQRTESSGSGTGVCADSVVQHPKRLVVVRFGDAVTISMPDGKLVEDPEGCVPDCPPTVKVTPLGCPGPEVETFQLETDGATWSVFLPPGAYELQVYGRFEAPDGSSGDTSAVLGILVDPQRKRGIVKAARDLFVCPPAT